MTDNKKRVIKLKKVDLSFEKDTINEILFYYINHIDFTPNYDEDFINEVCIVANKMSGCFGADYINHKVYAYLFEYAIKNNEPLPNGVFTDYEDIMSYKYEDNGDEEYSSNKCETCKSICGAYGCGNEDCEDYDPTGIYEETERDNMKDMLSEM
jgi:hypothetical protein